MSLQIDMKFLENVSINNGALLYDNNGYCVTGALFKALGCPIENYTTPEERNRYISLCPKLFDKLYPVQNNLMDSLIPEDTKVKPLSYNPISPLNAKRLMLEIVKEYVG